MQRATVLAALTIHMLVAPSMVKCDGAALDTLRECPWPVTTTLCQHDSDAWTVGACDYCGFDLDEFESQCYGDTYDVESYDGDGCFTAVHSCESSYSGELIEWELSVTCGIPVADATDLPSCWATPEQVINGDTTTGIPYQDMFPDYHNYGEADDSDCNRCKFSLDGNDDAVVGCASGYKKVGMPFEAGVCTQEEPTYCMLFKVGTYSERAFCCK